MQSVPRSVCLSALARFTRSERVSKEKTSSEMITESVYAVRMSIKRTQTTLNSIRWKYPLEVLLCKVSQDLSKS